MFHQAPPKPFTGEPLNEDQSIGKKSFIPIFIHILPENFTEVNKI